jgi:hypothetical protein
MEYKSKSHETMESVNKKTEELMSFDMLLMDEMASSYLFM